MMSFVDWHFSPELIEEFLARALSADTSAQPARARLQSAMRGAVFSGGKRLRSQLVLEAAHAASTRAHRELEPETVVPAAAAIELVHAYSLVHDDLPAMDNADTRRGQPSCHKTYGEATAILVGDALLTLAFEIMASAPLEANAAAGTQAVRAIQILARAAGESGMVGGQMIDIAWSNALERDHDLDHLNISGDVLLSMHALKTGALIRAACEIGATLGSGDQKIVNALGNYGAQLGRAFQLKDDLLDVEGDPQKTGKGATDAANDKITAPALLGLEATRVLAQAAHDAALKSLSIFGEEADALRSLARFVVEREQ